MEGSDGPHRPHRGRLILLLLLLAILLERSTFMPERLFERQVEAMFSRQEFNIWKWELGAVWSKAGQELAATQGELSPTQRKALVMDYMRTMQRINELRWEINRIYAQAADPERESRQQREELQRLRRKQQARRPLVEAILEEQVASILIEEGLGRWGYAWPPVRFRFEQLPLTLIVSPRDEIQVIAQTHLVPGIPIERWEVIEQAVESTFDNTSALVTEIGGLSAYPTMVIETPSLNFIASVVAHEWTHNYLYLFPLGLSYDKTPQLRTMNETVADIVGDEVGARMIERYYPELVPPPSPPEQPPTEEEKPRFDFNAFMRETRLHVDDLLSQGRVEEAERYMEERRQELARHGYYIRKLNQAYFAFHGSYAAGPAAVDPIGGQLKSLRRASPSLKAFLRTVRGMDSYDDLLQVLEERGLRR